MEKGRGHVLKTKLNERKAEKREVQKIISGKKFLTELKVMKP